MEYYVSTLHPFGEGRKVFICPIFICNAASPYDAAVKRANILGIKDSISNSAGYLLVEDKDPKENHKRKYPTLNSKEVVAYWRVINGSMRVYEIKRD